MLFREWRTRLSVMFILLTGIFFIRGAVMAAEPEYSKIIQAIAHDIERLKPEFNQLNSFSAARCVDLGRLSITYDFHTHEPQRRSGWTAGVPNPNPDGVWFYIDFHDRNSMAQIHTQPVAIPLCLGDKRVSFLILEGKKTMSVGERIRSILGKHGIVDCKNSRT